MDINKIKDKYASYGLDRQYEKTLLDEIRKRDRKIHMLTTTIAGLITLNLLLLMLIIFFR